MPGAVTLYCPWNETILRIWQVPSPGFGPTPCLYSRVNDFKQHRACLDDEKTEPAGQKLLASPVLLSGWSLAHIRTTPPPFDHSCGVL